MTLTAVEDILNASLRRIGYSIPIGFIYEGSKAGRISLDVYGQTRDDLLRAEDWPFARRDTTAIAFGQPAPSPWAYEFVYPIDSLKTRYIQPLNPGTGPVFDPRPTLFTDYNDTRVSPPQKTILSNISPATIVYTGQITDPATWEAGFTEALIEELARRLVVALDGNGELLKAEVQLADKATAGGIQSQVVYPPNPGIAPAAEPRKG